MSDKGSFENVPLNLLPEIFKYIPSHEQLTTVRLVCRFFKRGVEERSYLDFPEFADIKAQLSNKSLQKNAFNPHKLYHMWKPLDDESKKSLSFAPWCIAAFIGDIDALNELLGENLATTKDDFNAGVLHFAAMGGQIDLINHIVDQYNVNLSKELDKAKQTPLFYAAKTKQFNCAFELIIKHNLDMDQSYELGYSSAQLLVGSKPTQEQSLKLCEFLIDKETEQKARETLGDLVAGERNFHDVVNDKVVPCVPELAANFDLTTTENIESFMSELVTKIIGEERTQFIEYLSYLSVYHEILCEQRHEQSVKL